MLPCVVMRLKRKCGPAEVHVHRVREAVGSQESEEAATGAPPITV